MNGELEKEEERFAYKLVLPAVLIIALVAVFPLLYTTYISFHDVRLGNLGETPPFVGLQNYEGVVSGYRFKSAFLATAYISLSATALAILFGLGAALLLNQKIKGRGIFRAIALLPYVAPVVALAMAWSWIFQVNFGVANYAAVETGLLESGVAWFFTHPFATILVVLFEAWRYFPFCMLMILAGLQAISPTLHGAAEVDGANTFQKFRHITLPGIRSIVFILFLLRFVWNFNKFDDIFLLTGGAAETEVLPILAYRYFHTLPMKFGMASATSMFLFIVLIIFIPIYIKKVLKW